MNKEIKVFQSRNLSEYSRKLVELVKAGNEVLLDQCISLFGKIYTIKYYEAEKAIGLPVETLEKVEQEVTIELQDNQDNITEVVIGPSIADYESMSDEQLRILAKDAKIKGAHNAKRETLIEKLKG